MSQREAAEKIGVSARWVRELLIRMDKQGDAVVVHGLRSAAQYENFDFRGEFFIEGWIDSGIYFHAPEHGRNTWVGMQMKIFHQRDDKPALRKLRRRLPRTRAVNVRITLLENHRPRPRPLWKIQPRRQMLPIPHRDQHVLLGDLAQIDGGIGGEQVHRREEQGEQCGPANNAQS